MARRRLLLVVAAVFAGTAVVLAVAGVTANPLLLVLAVPFGAAAYLVFADVTGRVPRRFRRRRTRRTRRTGRTRRTKGTGSRVDASVEQSRAEARRVLGVDAGADDATIRRAYRDKVKSVHPDADGGDEEAFKRVSAAYERLRE